MKTTLIIPMAGDGQRFKDAGYEIPKPIIEVAGKPMFSLVVENVTSAVQYLFTEIQLVFIVRADHCQEFEIDEKIREIYPDAKILIIADKTEGAAMTVDIAMPYVDKDSSVMVANSDQYIDFGHVLDLNFTVDGCIFTFKASDEKWSYAKIRPDSVVVEEVAEKRVISNHATCGVYWWASADLYMNSLTKMVAENDRTNGEFYVCPLYNHMPHGSTTVISPVKEMLGIGTPEDLEKNQSRIEELVGFAK